jgi:L-2-hydroxyglutarate oxidase LhgO
VVDCAAYIASLAAAAEAAGGQIELGATLTGVSRNGSGFQLQVEHEGASEEIKCDLLVNSAGLAADRVAGLVGYPLDGEGEIPRLRQAVSKGRYYDVVNPARRNLLTHLVYPVPDRSGGFDVHVVLDVEGNLCFGPDTEWLPDGAALDYLADDTRRDLFAAAIQRYLPAITADDLAPGNVGYRPKLQRPGEEQQDFLIWQDRGYVHLGGIESPGLTASLALASYVASLI